MSAEDGEDPADLGHPLPFSYCGSGACGPGLGEGQRAAWTAAPRSERRASWGRGDTAGLTGGAVLRTVQVLNLCIFLKQILGLGPGCPTKHCSRLHGPLRGSGEEMGTWGSTLMAHRAQSRAVPSLQNREPLAS